MIYTVTLAMFPPWKAPVPYKTLDATFTTTREAVAAGTLELAEVIEQELAAITPVAATPPPRQSEKRSNGGSVTAIEMHDVAVHGLLVHDESGTEVFNWTTWDEAVDRAARA